MGLETLHSSKDPTSTTKFQTNDRGTFGISTFTLHQWPKRDTITKLSLRLLVRPLHELVEIEFIERLLLLPVMTRQRDVNVR